MAIDIDYLTSLLAASKLQDNTQFVGFPVRYVYDMHIYIYICMYVCMYVYIYIVYVCLLPFRDICMYIVYIYIR
jgi:hypothetical protein